MSDGGDSSFRVALAEQRIRVANERNKLARMLATCRHGSILKLVSSGGDSRYVAYCRTCEQYLPAELTAAKAAGNKSGMEWT